jgi:nucleotide-binding universal stress UspA family protein
MNILVPTDFSDFAQYAIDLAIEMAKGNEKVSIRLLHIVEAPSTNTFNAMGEVIMDDHYNNAYFVHRLNEAKKQLDIAQQNAAQKGVGMEMEVMVGNPYQHIAKVIPGRKVDLVIMGTKGASGIDEIIVGSNTEKVVRHAKCPVIALKHPITLKKGLKVAVASDFFSNNDLLLSQLELLNALTQAEIHLLFVNTPSKFKTTWETDAVMQKFSSRLASDNLTSHVINDHVEEEGITRFVEENGIDMIMIGTAGRKGLLHLLTGSIAEDIVNHTNAAVWVFPNRK